jgi:uncharacterized protein
MTQPVSLRELAAVTPDRFAALLAGPPEIAAAWVAAAAENGVVEAQVVYAQYLLDGHGVARDPAAAFRWFRHAAQADHPMGMNMLGRCYEFGWGTAACASVAVYWYREAARAGLDWGMYNYATALALGNGIEEDREAALAWFEQAAALGHAKSQNLIGGFYEDGWVVEANRDAALACYRRAAEGGDFRGQFNLARLLGERGEVAEALDWLARVPRTATPAFVEKMRAHLAESPIAAFRAVAQAQAASSMESAS